LSLRNLALRVVVVALVPLAVPAEPLASDGVGRMDVTPTKVVAGSSGNRLTFTFTADTGALVGQTLIDVPRGFSPPQTTTAGATGFVQLQHGSCSSATRIARVVARKIVITTSCGRGAKFTMTYGPAAAPLLSSDGYVFLTQTKPTVKPVRHAKKKRPAVVFRPLAPKKQPVVLVVGGPVDHLVVSATSVATANTPFGVNVRALDAYGNGASGYTNTVSISSTDPLFTPPGPYTYTLNDTAAHAFTGVIMHTAGVQYVTAVDSSGFTATSNPITVYPSG
jgi:hypothetical protein